MPLFPNINTLSLKDILSGEETIQISASERTTLDKISQLALNQPIGNFVPFLESLGGTIINSEDSLLVTLEKLYTRAGADKANLFPISYDVYYGIGGILYLGLTGTTQGPYFLIAILFDTKNGMKPYLWYGIRDMSPSEDNSSPANILDWLKEEGKHIPLSSPDEPIQVSGSGLIDLNPGQLVTCDHNDTSFRLSPVNWAKGNVYGGQNFTASIVSRFNITHKAFYIPPFNSINGAKFPGTVHQLFMEDFDIDPGTDWQAVTVQLFIANNKNNNKAYRFFFNKCGYNPIS